MTNTKFESFSEKLMGITQKIQSSKLINGVTNGMISALPVTLVGAFAALFQNIPIEVWQNFIVSSGIKSIFAVIIMFSTNFLAVIFTVSIAINYAKQHDDDGRAVGLLALMNFFIVTPVATGDSGTSIPMQWLGGFGIFAGIIIATVTTRLYLYLKKKGITIKLPDSVPPTVSNSFASLIPGFATVVLFGIVAFIFSNTSFGSFHQFIYTFLQTPLQGVGANIVTVILFWTLAQLLWFMGIHGTLVILSVMMPLFAAIDAEQLSAYAAGQALPYIVTRSFISTFTVSASAIGFTLLLLFFSKSKAFKAMGKLTTIPALFGITEPLVFGVPLVFNFKFAIPFIFGNAVSIIIAYVSTVIGLIPRVPGITVTGIPVVISGFINGGIRIALMQLFLIGVQVLIWYPFFKSADNAAYLEEQSKETEK